MYWWNMPQQRLLCFASSDRIGLPSGEPNGYDSADDLHRAALRTQDSAHRRQDYWLELQVPQQGGA